MLDRTGQACRRRLRFGGINEARELHHAFVGLDVDLVRLGPRIPASAAFTFVVIAPSSTIASPERCVVSTVRLL